MSTDDCAIRSARGCAGESWRTPPGWSGSG